MPEDTFLSPLDAKNAEERRITLEGPKDPENFMMPDGRTFAQTVRDKFEKDTEEGIAADEIQKQRVREQSMAGDPLYATPKSQVVEDKKQEPVVASKTVVEAPKETPKQKEI